MRLRAPALLIFAGALCLAGCPREPETKTPAASAPASAAAPSREDAARAIMAALRAGDKAGFRGYVSRRMLSRHEGDFDQWFEIWKEGAAKMTPEQMAKEIAMVQEDGVWKIDEN
jgi:hypothetical protein